MSGRVTMQDIADSLGLSRNTVSKAFNNTGVIAESTKDLILRKAAEMGYKNSSGSAMPNAIPIASDKKEIAMLTCYIPGGSHFAVTTIDRIQQNLSSCGYSLTFYRVTQSELMDLRLPGSFSPDKVAAIFCMELFNYEYCEMLCSLPIPLLFIDTPVKPGRSPLMADTLFMENQAGIYSFVSQIAEKGKNPSVLWEICSIAALFSSGQAPASPLPQFLDWSLPSNTQFRLFRPPKCSCSRPTTSLMLTCSTVPCRTFQSFPTHLSVQMTLSP